MESNVKASHFIVNYESSPIKDADGNILQIRTILFCPTGNSEANPVYKTLSSLDDDDIILQYSDDQLNVLSLVAPSLL